MHRRTAARLAAVSLAAVSLAAASLTACAGAPAPGARPATTAAVTAAERVVQAQLEAYNRHDLDAFVATYHPDVRGYTYPDRPMFTGVAELRTTYAEFFAAAPTVRARIVRRIVQGNHVIDHEEVTGMPGAEGPVRAVAVYEVREGRIASVRFIQ